MFQAGLVDLAGSGMLRRAQAVVLPFASPNAFLSVQSELPRASEFVLGQGWHRARLEAIEGREGARAEALAREHARLAASSRPYSGGAAPGPCVSRAHGRIAVD